MTARQVECEIEGVDPATFRATWSGALPLEAGTRLATPGDDPNVRVLVEEHEMLPTDPGPGAEREATISRLVDADHLRI